MRTALGLQNLQESKTYSHMKLPISFPFYKPSTMHDLLQQTVYPPLSVSTLKYLYLKLTRNFATDMSSLIMPVDISVAIALHFTCFYWNSWKLHYLPNRVWNPWPYTTECLSCKVIRQLSSQGKCFKRWDRNQWHLRRILTPMLVRSKASHIPTHPSSFIE